MLTIKRYEEIDLLFEQKIGLIKEAVDNIDCYVVNPNEYVQLEESEFCQYIIQKIVGKILKYETVYNIKERIGDNKLQEYLTEWDKGKIFDKCYKYVSLYELNKKLDNNLPQKEEVKTKRIKI